MLFLNRLNRCLLDLLLDRFLSFFKHFLGLWEVDGLWELRLKSICRELKIGRSRQRLWGENIFHWCIIDVLNEDAFWGLTLRLLNLTKGLFAIPVKAHDVSPRQTVSELVNLIVNLVAHSMRFLVHINILFLAMVLHTDARISVLRGLELFCSKISCSFKVFGR